ncbi:putative Exopolyphosphatase [Nitrospira sp. KM1]|uniref:Ppx/GppA phosphatase family protein n=1 Tax=Nitrospira sp. KM1 TaxID=1936990 RepID=UPI0013A752AB|nr:Ppx/GppA phosphatase family protein [Nitrospira sp. KM1]BCA53134.1 putative Exopolyphosphatase [Nitrospira sp. KM1]
MVGSEIPILIRFSSYVAINLDHHWPTQPVMTRLAVIDIGTNSIHMVLADVQPDGTYKILDRFKDMTRLGNGTFTTLRLSDEAMARGLDVLRNLVTLARNKGYERIIAVATSAVREAKNGGDFIDLVAEQTGLKIRVISGPEEARLIFLGIKNSVPMSDQPVLAVDVGGGSVELMVGNRDQLLHAKSLKLGAIRLADEFLKRTPPSDGMLHSLEESVSSQLKAALETFKTKRYDSLIATSGMAGNLAEVIHLKKTNRPLPQLNLATVSIKDVKEIEQELRTSTIKERLALPGLDPKRVDTLFPATIVLRRLMELSGRDEIVLCDKAIREGVIYDFTVRHRDRLKAEAEIPDLRRRNVIALAKRCHAPDVHSLQVASLALRLFDQTKRLHGLGSLERDWLEYAAILHDIGYLINERQHHKHAYYLITHSDIGGLSSDELHIIANVARYHRRAVPHSKHDGFDVLAPRFQRVVRILSSLLRIADGLDRTHFSVVRSLDVKIGPSVTITATVSGDAELEAWAARGRADLFERVFRRRVQLNLTPQEDTA